MNLQEKYTAMNDAKAFSAEKVLSIVIKYDFSVELVFKVFIKYVFSQTQNTRKKGF
jgi:hypothetical protein